MENTFSKLGHKFSVGLFALVFAFSGLMLTGQSTYASEDCWGWFYYEDGEITGWASNFTQQEAEAVVESNNNKDGYGMLLYLASCQSIANYVQLSKVADQ